MIGVKAIRFPDLSQVGAASSAQGSTQPRSRIRSLLPLALTRPILAASGLNVSRSKATSLPLGEIDASMSTAPFFGRVSWRRWLPSGLAETMYCLENDLVFRDQTMVEALLAAGAASSGEREDTEDQTTPVAENARPRSHAVSFRPALAWPERP